MQILLNLVSLFMGGSAKKADLESRFVITLESRDASFDSELPRYVSVSGITFEKYMTKTYLPYSSTILLVTCDLLVTHHPPSTIPKKCLGDAMCGFVFASSKFY